MTDERESPQELDADEPVDDLRYAPPVEAQAGADEADEAPDTPLPEDESVAEETAPDDAVALPESEMAAAPEVDLDAALAAISALDDMLAEQEAAEHAELERERAEAQAVQEHQTRLKSPELFFPMPPLAGLPRGRIDSVVPALALIGLGAWLTLAVTTGGGMPAPAVLILVVAGGLSITLLARWLATRRWALGALYIALTILLTAGLFVFLLGQGRLITEWPLLIAGPGAAFFISGLLARDGRLLLPGLLTCAAALVALGITGGLLPEATLAAVARLWPIAGLIVVLLLALAWVGRRRHTP